MKFSFEKQNKYKKIASSTIILLILMFFNFATESIYAQKGNIVNQASSVTDIITNNEEGKISQNISYLSPSFIFEIKAKKIKEKNKSKVLITKNSFSIANSINIDYKNPKKNNNISDGVLKDENKIKYTVRKDDDIIKIAEKFGVTVSTIRVENSLTNSIVREGQVLVILPTSGFTYTVRRGDTIASIIKKNNILNDDLKTYNFLSEDSLKTGQDIIIPVNNYYKKIYIPKKITQRKINQTRYSSKPKKQEYLKSSGNVKRKYVSGRGYYTHPAPGAVRTQGIHGRNAVDLASGGGRHIPIVAAASGTIKRARRTNGWYGGYGMNVLISHSNGSQTMYAHMSKVIVYEGQYVSKGQIIGYMGSTGRSTGVHLHFEIRGGPRNPF